MTVILVCAELMKLAYKGKNIKCSVFFLVVGCLGSRSKCFFCFDNSDSAYFVLNLDLVIFFFWFMGANIF